MDDLTECCRELVIAIFRLAVSDCLGLECGHDGPPVRRRRTCGPHSDDASSFLYSRWADHLADVAGFSADAVRCELRQLIRVDRPVPLSFRGS